jgi:hypothetical protein
MSVQENTRKLSNMRKLVENHPLTRELTEYKPFIRVFFERPVSYGFMSLQGIQVEFHSQSKYSALKQAFDKLETIYNQN